MTRRGIFAALAAVTGAVAQQWKQCVPDDKEAESMHLGKSAIVCSDKNKPALNNQCPVCGTMAEPYHRPTGGVHIVPCGPGVIGSNVVCAEPGEPYGPTEIIVRCKHCNAAFWQDAEDRPPHG